MPGDLFESQLQPRRPAGNASNVLPGSFGHNFSGVGVSAAKPEPGRPKLKMSQPGDQYELEADRIAEGVLSRLGTSGADAPRQKAASVADAIGKHEEGGVVDALTTQTSSAQDAETGPAQNAPSVQAQLRSLPRGERNLANHLPSNYGTGQRLPPEAQAAVEPLLGYDLSTVRIYPKEADQVATDIHARAFTLGRDIYFRKGEYNPESRDGMRVLLHELVHTTQPDNDGGMLQLTPYIDSWSFHASGTASPDNCCTACPGAFLGVDTSFYGAGSFTNGMELQAFISDDEPGATYDIKRTKERSAWQRIAGAWTLCCGGHVGPGADDDPPPNSLDECLFPSSSPGHIYSLDEPGFMSTGSLNAAATEAVYKASFVESVEIVDALGGGVSDSNIFEWHSMTWLTKAGGSWDVDTAKSEIAPGAINVGTTGP